MFVYVGVRGGEGVNESKKQRETIRKRKIGGRYCKTTAWDWYVCLPFETAGTCGQAPWFQCYTQNKQTKDFGQSVCLCVCASVRERVRDSKPLCISLWHTHTHIHFCRMDFPPKVTMTQCLEKSCGVPVHCESLGKPFVTFLTLHITCHWFQGKYKMQI